VPRASNRNINKKLLGLVLMAIYVFCLAANVKLISASPGLTLKWTTITGDTAIGPLAADLNGDGKMEIVVTGNTTKSLVRIWALRGTDGSILWSRDLPSAWPQDPGHTPFEIADLNKDGLPEIVISANTLTVALHGNDGSTYWEARAPSFGNWPAIADVDGDGYPEVFVCSGMGPNLGSDTITMLSHDGNILHQAYSWHSCWGGLTIGDANFDGRFELYQGDRANSYSGRGEKYLAGGLGLRALDAQTLTPLWNDPTVFCSSQSPVLADVDKDGILDVIVGTQLSNGIAVLNSADGSVLTTGGKYRKSWTNMTAHSQVTVADVDGDGNLELINTRGASDANKTPPIKIWDLYNWKSDGTIPVKMDEPPKVGDVTGDGNLDIICVSFAPADYGAIYIYSYNNSTKTYGLVDSVPPLWDGVRAFTLVQDVDGDNLNELVTTSSTGRVRCFDTPARTPTPRVRSNVQFYSEYKRGSAEYVPPSIPSQPVLVDERPLDGSLNQSLNPTLSVRATDFQADRMNITFKTNVTGVWEDIGTYTNAVSGVYNVTTTNMNSVGTTYHWGVAATDGKGNTIWGTYRLTTYSNPPTQTNPRLANETEGNLIAHNQTTIDPDGDEITNIYKWYVNNKPYANLLLPFDTRTTNSPMVDEEFFKDGFENGFSNWDGNGATNWDLSTSQKHSGLYSAHAGRGNSYLTSDNLDTSSAEGLTISFWYREHGVSASNNAYLQFWNGTAYTNIFELGVTVPEDTWHWYTFQTYDPRYLSANFNFRLDARSIAAGGDLWIDDVSITFPTRTKDYSGYKNHGTIDGATWTNDGAVGGAYNFDGANDYIRIPDNPSLGGDGTWSEISIEFWIKPVASAHGTTIIAKKTPYTSVGSYMVGFQSDASEPANTLFFGINSSSDMKWHNLWDDGTTSLEIGRWHHVVCTYQSGPGLAIYIDGTKRANAVLTGNIAQAPGASVYNKPLFIGYDGGGDQTRRLNGTLDEVAIYPRALSPAQIFQRYLETKDGLSNKSTMVKQETRPGEAWKCQVTPNDGFGDGESKFSNDLTLFPLNLTIQTIGNGTTNPAPTTYTYYEGSTIIVNALPSYGWKLDRWLLDNSDAGNDNPYTLIMNSNHNLTAVFTEITAKVYHNLTIVFSGNGITNPAPGVWSYEEGTKVPVYANPDIGWMLSHWILDYTNVGSDNPHTVEITSDHNLTAVFVEIPPPIQYNLTVRAAEHGITHPTPGVYAYNENSIVSVEAIPDSGWILSYWLLDGANVGRANPYNVTIDANHNLTAVFIEKPLFSDGFESGNFAGWSGVAITSGETATVVNTKHHHDQYSAKFTSNGGQYAENANCYTMVDLTEVYVRGYFYIETGLPLMHEGDRFYLIRLGGATQNLAYMGIRRDNGVDQWMLYVRNGGNWMNWIHAANPLPQQGIWYSVELHWKMSSTGGLVELYINGTRILQVQNINTAYWGNAKRIDFGLPYISSPQNNLAIYGDCAVVSGSYVGSEPPQKISVQTSTAANVGFLVPDAWDKWSFVTRAQ